MRKPAIGMALKAKQIFKNISLENSVMVGDTISDMQFGRNAAMKNIFIKHETDKEKYDEKLIDFTFNSLLSFAKKLE
jgi:histidinol phosphatase-like enzyme